MNVLVIGSGGREHALCLAFKKSARARRILCTPGNAGIGEVAEVLPCEASPQAWADLAEREGIDLTVVGPDGALEAGIVDEFRSRGLAIFGPTRAAARLEWSKAFAKAFMERHGVPTARYAHFSQLEAALGYVRREAVPLVVKNSGLALGKGVTVAHTLAQAEAALEAIFAAEGAEVVIEEFMRGIEVSCIALCDGARFAVLPSSQDHKTIGEGDTGPMTGGMGVIAPYPLTPEQREEVETRILAPILRGMALEGTPFVGALYPGLMLTDEGVKVVEINARFGDPECEALLPLLESDLLEALLACVEGRLEPEMLRFAPRSSALVVLASPGYPASSTPGIPLEIPNDLPTNLTVFHCGTAREGGRLTSRGGRVLAVQATAETLENALHDVYLGVSRIGFAGAQYRRDIGFRLGLPRPQHEENLSSL